MADKIHKYLDKIDELKEEVDRQSESILDKIDMTNLLSNPVEYMKELGRQFFEAHTDELQEAINVGETKARAVLSEIKKD